MAEVIDENVIDTLPPSVGQRLQQAREAKKFSIAEVAAQLRFTKETIVNLEEQHWGKLHGRAYARGYFSNYVKFLGLDETEMLAAFNLEYRASEPNLNSPHLMTASKSKFPWMGAVFIVLAIVITWFAYQQWQLTKAIESDDLTNSPWQQPEEPQTPEQFDAFEASVVEPLEQDTSYDEENVLPEVSEQNVENEQDLMPLEPIEDTFDVEQVEETQPEPLTLQTEIVDELEEVIAEDVVDEAVALSQTEMEDALQNTKLELLASADCWVEVSDADAKILVYKTIKAGERVSISGKAPLNVLLGSASNVEVKVNDTHFETSSYSEGNVARFSVGVQS